MKTSFVCLLAMITWINSHAQKGLEKELLLEGTKLYKSEMASWYGSDVFMAKFGDKKVNAGGYFSYTDGERSTCIFFSKDNQPKVLATISFDSTYTIETSVSDGQEREFSNLEKDLFEIRKIAFREINSDTLFKTYKNTSLNLIPIADEKGKRVYVLTGPQNNGVVLFGNDYLLLFDESNKLKSKSRLHKSLIPIEFGTKDGKVIIASMHTHLPESSEYITATDICTLMLYSKYAKWKQHYVMSKDFVSIWNADRNNLLLMKKEIWDKIYKDQEQRKSDGN